MPASRDVFLGPRGTQSPRRTWLPRTEQQPLRRHGGAAGSHRGLRTDTGEEQKRAAVTAVRSCVPSPTGIYKTHPFRRVLGLPSCHGLEGDTDKRTRESSRRPRWAARRRRRQG